MVKILLAAIAKFKMEYYVFDYTPTLTFLPEEPEFRTGTFLSDCEMHCNGEKINNPPKVSTYAGTDES